jgi:hypothetical protein
VENRGARATLPFFINCHQDYVVVLFRLSISSRLVKLNLVRILICLLIVFGFIIL